MPKSLQQFIKFCLVGCLNTAVDFGVYFVLTRNFAFWGDHLVLAQMCSMACATVNSYMWNSFWTFQTKRTDHGVLAAKFLTVSLSGYVLNTLFFAGLVHIGVLDLVAKVGLTLFLLAWNFVGNKWWVYTGK